METDIPKRIRDWYTRRGIAQFSVSQAVQALKGSRASVRRKDVVVAALGELVRTGHVATVVPGIRLDLRHKISPMLKVVEPSPA